MTAEMPVPLPGAVSHSRVSTTCSGGRRLQVLYTVGMDAETWGFRATDHLHTRSVTAPHSVLHVAPGCTVYHFLVFQCCGVYCIRVLGDGMAHCEPAIGGDVSMDDGREQPDENTVEK